MAVVKPLSSATPRPTEPVEFAGDPSSPELDRARRHWRATLRLTAALLAVWFAVGFVVTWFARDLDFVFFGWPFSFWVAAQGGPLVFVGLLAVYARRMRRIDAALRDDGPREAAGSPARRAAR